MKISQFKNHIELPLFLNAATVSKVLGVSPSSGYELMHETDFPGKCWTPITEVNCESWR